MNNLFEPFKKELEAFASKVKGDLYWPAPELPQTFVVVIWEVGQIHYEIQMTQTTAPKTLQVICSAAVEKKGERYSRKKMLEDTRIEQGLTPALHKARALAESFKEATFLPWDRTSNS